MKITSQHIAFGLIALGGVLPGIAGGMCLIAALVFEHAVFALLSAGCILLSTEMLWTASHLVPFKG